MELKSLYKEYPLESGKKFETLQNINMSISKGTFISIIGPSGCGKSTLFNIISGLESPTSGEVFLNGDIIINKKGLVSYMPQKDYLLPWRSVLDNIILGMEIKGIKRKEAREIARNYLEPFGLEGFENELPSSLSGGMRQRAALLRTILLKNDVLLLDEPFGALDEITRIYMQQWLLGIWEKYRHTIVFVTHSIDEAIFLSDIVYVLSPRPARIKYKMEVNLPRPRQSKMMTEKNFSDYKKKLFDELTN